MQTPPSDTPVKPNRSRRGRWLVVLVAFAGLAWSLPRPLLHDVVIETADDSSTTTPRGRLAFRTAELLAEFSGKGSLADETELSGPCFADDGQTLYFSRTRPGQRADIVRSTLGEDRWLKPEPVRELNSVDDDRRLTMSADGRTAALASNRSGGHGGFDLYESTNDGHRWSKPRNAGVTINTDAAEFDPALAPDGLTMFFVRVAPGEKADLFVTRRESLDAAWPLPQPVESINSIEFHERSPAVSPDGSWLLFASNRGGRSGEPAPFALFRAPLLDGHVGAAERLRDGIASETDDLDAAFTRDGRSLAFVSKRGGAKQLFLSRGEFVVTRLTISTAHLEPFGRAKWGVPFAGLVLFLLVWRWSRRARAAAVVVVAPVTRPATAAPKRSEPPKNPLASWTITAPAETPPAAMPVNPLAASAKLSSETVPPTVVPLKLEPARPSRRRSVVAVVVIAAGVLFALRTTIWNQRPVTDTLRTIDLDSLDVVTFLEIAPSSAAELPQFDRLDTLQRSAPQPVAPPSNTVALRPAARWPNDRVVVRQPVEVARLSDIEPPQSQLTRLAVLARQPLPSELTRPTVRPPEAASVAVVASELEKPNAAASISTAQQMFVPSATERTAVPSAAANQAALRAPAARVTQLAPTSIALSSGADGTRLTSLVRSGSTNRIAAPSSLTEPEALSGLTVITATESPLVTQTLNVPRTEAAPIGQPIASVAARSLLPPHRTVSTVTGSSVSSPAENVSTKQLPAKSPATPQAIPLSEEVVLLATSATLETINSNAASAPPRVESPGPQPSLLPTTLLATNTARPDLTTMRSPSRIESTESSARTPESRIGPTIARRDSPLPVIAAAAVESAAGPMPGSPAILLTSTTMLVELLTSATLAPLPRAGSAGPMPTVTTSSVSEFARWLSRVAPLTVLGESRSETEPRTPASATAIPRQARTVTPAELPEAP